MLPQCGGCQFRTLGMELPRRYPFISKLGNQDASYCGLCLPLQPHFLPPADYLPPMPICMVVSTSPRLCSKIPSALSTKGPVLGSEGTLRPGCRTEPLRPRVPFWLATQAGEFTCWLFFKAALWFISDK